LAGRSSTLVLTLIVEVIEAEEAGTVIRSIPDILTAQLLIFFYIKKYPEVKEECSSTATSGMGHERQ
jgi:hypothetical protein